MLRAVLRVISRTSVPRNSEMQAVLQQRSAAAMLHANARQARCYGALPLAVVAAQRQQLSSLWQSVSSRPLHSKVAAAESEVDQLADADRDTCDVYQAEFDSSYIHYGCVTGTVEHGLTSIQGVKGESWLKFTMKVPTPNCNTYTKWYILANSDLAKNAGPKVKEGLTYQVSGTLLQAESLQAAGWSGFLQTPALFADGIGEIQADFNVLSERIILPAMNPADVETFIASGGQQLRAPMPKPPAAAAARGAPAPAAEPIYAPGMPPQPSNDVEAAWMSLFMENHLWIDQRNTRQGKQPDFKMRDSKNIEGRKTAVWIEDRKMPAWAKANLQMLPGGQPYVLPPFIPESAMSGSDIERQWVNVFTSYSSFWDNRVNKLNPKGPDFSPRDREAGGLALWISDNRTPSWVIDNQDKLPEAPARKG